MTDRQHERAHCEDRIADLTLRIASVKASLPDTAVGVEPLAALELIEQTLDRWRQRLKTLNARGADV